MGGGGIFIWERSFTVCCACQVKGACLHLMDLFEGYFKMEVMHGAVLNRCIHLGRWLCVTETQLKPS